MNRRDFLLTGAAAGAGLILSPLAFAAETQPAKVDDLNVALIGAGSQGRILLQRCLKIPGIRFRAVCDIWPYHQKYAKNILKAYKQPVNVYTDYQELLAKEKDLDAVLIASPDWVHAEQTIACLKAGLDVYCEKEMSNTLEGAKQMVLTARKTKRRLQIGHQRRSNPRYQLADKIIHKDKILGRITHFEGHWNRARLLERSVPPKKHHLDKATLKKYGYESMQRFRNWRWFPTFSSGPIADLGSHQIDIFSWFLRTNPSAVMASGSVDYYKASEWYDNVIAIYEYKTAEGMARGSYGIFNTTSHGGFTETFMGDQGSLVISEDSRTGFIFREIHAKKKGWEDVATEVEVMGQKAIELKVGESRKARDEKDSEALQEKETDGDKPDEKKKKKPAPKPVHTYHLENFFDAIRLGTALSCPGEVGYETAVAVLRVNEAIKKGARLEFKPDDFKI